MSDIVERLRAFTATKVEAADEIERLCNELAAERERALQASMAWQCAIEERNAHHAAELNALEQAEKAEAERDALRELLQEARDLLLAARGCLKPFYGADVRARIDAALTETEK